MARTTKKLIICIDTQRDEVRPGVLVSPTLRQARIVEPITEMDVGRSPVCAASEREVIAEAIDNFYCNGGWRNPIGRLELEID